MLSITKTTVSYTCCLCDEKRSTPIDCVIPDYGNNPFPLKSVKEVKKGVRCCDKCNWEKVMTARFGFPIVFTGK